MTYTNENRLDFISNIQADCIDRMGEIRKAYMDIDAKLAEMLANPHPHPAATRTIACARTNLEISLQFAIKSLCLIGEIKND